MGRHKENKCKLCRRENKKLFLKGPRCDSDKCAFDHRPTPPGLPPKKGGLARVSGYAIHLREKQKARRIYGVSERQFKRYFSIAKGTKGITGELLLQLLERRLDNVIYRLGFAKSRGSARQLVTHGHFLINNRRASIPSQLVNIGDEITLKEKSQKLNVFIETLSREYSVPLWLFLDKESFKGRMVKIPERKDIPVDLKEELIVELYSK